MNRMMIDIETCGLSFGAAVLTLGYCVFSKSEILLTRTWRLELTPTGYYDPKTIVWWMAQSEKAREEAWLGDRMSHRGAMTELAHHYISYDCKEVWSHGAGFDIPRVERLIESAGWENRLKLTFNPPHIEYTPPWHYRTVRDTRTLFAVWAQRTNADGYDYTPLGIPDINAGLTHTAGYDARYQATQVQEALNALGMD